ncbi:MAG: hypothetical protein ABIZ05_07775 [Pseudonocardiaceae bacterium]
MSSLAPAGCAVLAGVGVAVPPAPDPGGQGAEFGKAAPVALVLLLLLALAVTLLVRSMNKHLRRVPKSFDEEPHE